MFKAIIDFFIRLFGKKEETPHVAAPTPLPPDISWPKDPEPTTPVIELPRQVIKGTLRFGMSGEDVKKLQLQLLLTGHFEGEALGNFKELTLAAVKAFQQDHDLNDDGVVGAMTAAKLNFVFETPLTTDDQNLTLAEVFKIPEGSLPWYRAAYDALTYDPGFETRIKNVAERIKNNMPRYQAAGKTLNIPWFFIAALHNMESGGSFAGVLHNGEKILGTGRKTTLVPKGRGPFGTWEQSAVDAMKMKNFHVQTDWSLEQCLRRSELYNGTGYISGKGRQDTSPYLWSCTNINDNTGKFTADGHYDPKANSNGQVGVAAIYKELERMGLIAFTRTNLT